MNVALKDDPDRVLDVRDSARLVFSDGYELPVVRCTVCRCFGVPGHVCSGCEARTYREAAARVSRMAKELGLTLATWDQMDRPGVSVPSEYSSKA